MQQDYNNLKDYVIDSHNELKDYVIESNRGLKNQFFSWFAYLAAFVVFVSVLMGVKLNDLNETIRNASDKSDKNTTLLIQTIKDVSEDYKRTDERIKFLIELKQDNDDVYNDK